MTDEQKELLISTGVTEDELKHYYVSPEGLLFMPLTDKKGIMVKTGEQVYTEDYLNPPMPEPTLSERLESMENMLTLLMGV